ncbi:hypothetical protein [Rubrobacter indicoceani]|uniref:hypothetical protein n=1 Tax=Rubrobacter indicoceani TaxID=2051957 RepID=UPI000E5A34AC|nr:hypothetical protein [Rubrobacter indicoceani]
MPLQKRVGEYVMHQNRNRNTKSKFVITGAETWFVGLDGVEGVEAPSLIEMLVAAAGVDISDRAEVEAFDGKLENGKVLLGYVSDRVVEIHSPAAAPFPYVLRRVKDIFGNVRVMGPGWTMDTGEDRPENER